MRKIYVLDTNVLIHDPKSIFQFEDNYLYIPIYVLEELDKIKGEHSSRGRNSREACRLLDEFRTSGSLSDGVDINDDGKLFIYVPTSRKVVNVALERNSADNAILQCFAEIRDSQPPEQPVILVTMDINLRVRAESLKFQTATYESQSIDFSNLVTGMVDYDANNGDIDLLYATGTLPVEDGVEFYHNACVTIKEISGKTALGRYYKDARVIKPLNIPKEGVMNIRARNKEQTFAMDLLLDDNVKVVSLIGLPGSGKTLLSSVIGLHKVIKEAKYSRLTIARPIVVLGNDIGYLPGSIAEKLDPYMKPIYDQLDLILIGGGKKSKQDKFATAKYEDLIKQGVINVEPITYIRGRSLHNQWVLIDESQNLSMHEVKTIITRTGENCKIIFTGDPSQIDTPYLDRNSCGIAVMTEKLHDHPIVGHITMVKGERSELANLANQRLE
jgi:PhoH-like ATPase